MQAAVQRAEHGPPDGPPGSGLLRPLVGDQTKLRFGVQLRLRMLVTLSVSRLARIMPGAGHMLCAF